MNIIFYCVIVGMFGTLLFDYLGFPLYAQMSANILIISTVSVMTGK